MCLGVVILVAMLGARVAAAQGFDYSSVLFGPSSTLSLTRTAFNASTGAVTYNGVDTRQPATPFTWDWGDGQIINGWFPQTHTYSDLTRNYVLTVTSHYPGGGTDAVSSVVRFVAPQLTPASFPPDLAVTVPSQMVSLTTRLYTPPSSLTAYTDGALGGITRSAWEHVLTAGATVQAGCVQGNVYRDNGSFSQVLLNDPVANGMYSIWYTNPVALASGGPSLSLGNVSSYFHEMGHNVTLNFPASYYYGGRIDGNANAIYSETLAQILQHATSHSLINHASDYGLGADVVADIRNSALASMKLVRNSYDSYRVNPVFHSWNAPATPPDETLNTFMTLAYVFFEQAELTGQGTTSR